MAMPEYFSYKGPARGLVRAWYRAQIISPDGKTQGQVDEELVRQLREELKERNNA